MNEAQPPVPERYRHDLEVIRTAADLVRKDFAMFGVAITFSGDATLAYGELKSQLVPVIETALRDRPDMLAALLYRIDVDERRYADVRRREPAAGRAAAVADLVLEKELAKAVFRKVYAAKKFNK